MAINIEKIKRDFGKNRAKTAILAVLAIVMTGLFAKAASDMRPRTAAAALVPAADSGTAVTPEAAADAESRIRESRDLWKILRETRGGIDASAAFRFDPAYFPMDPNRPQVMAERPEVVVPGPSVARPAVSNEEVERGAADCGDTGAGAVVDRAFDGGGERKQPADCGGERAYFNGGGSDIGL